MLELLTSPKIKHRQKFLRLGAELDNPALQLVYNTELGRETYTKILLTEDGDCEHTNCPVTLLLGCDNWRVMELRGNNCDSLYIAYDPAANQENMWYQDIAYEPNNATKNSWYSDLAKRFPITTKVPSLYGDLVVFRPDQPLEWNELVLRRELLNWLVMKYRYKSKYKFCD